MMRRVSAIAFLITIACAASAAAQARIEVSVLGGYTWAEGVTGKDFTAGNGNIYNGASSTNSGSFGFMIGLSEGHGEYGFLYRRQLGQFQVTGPTTTTILGNMATDNYHGYFTYYFGNPDGKVQFYVTAGAGMTHFGKVNVTAAGGGSATLVGRSEFSPTFGGGVRFLFSESLGFRFGVQYTPVYITDDPNNMWCDPTWGCYLVGNPQYASQADALAAVTFRFGGK